MEDKKVILIRKQGTPFIVNYPHDGTTTTYTWQGTKGTVLNERPVPFDVFDYLQNETVVFQTGALIIKETQDEDIKLVKENIPEIEQAENSIMTRKEVIDLFTTGNHLVLKKALNELTEGKSEIIAEDVKKYIVSVAVDEGIDSSAKRKVICEWAGLEYENSDLFFDNNLKEMYEK
ncbi:hypothetical protein ADU80_00210 (plasmid) [Clostridium botulinum]|uniref:Uncharacterized protein n=2 Tax=Clostridium botulinum TaxID=1491 RepID=A0A9Q1UXZ0_CLOBO|nr:hypothetical protein [Clostridium botulinum]AEB77384.1 conserved hypothetical phage-related protein [Clostridium botulinum BKT015925]KEH96372.1 hypothetical protein Y848_13920 [Clostridium botulinum C/D str. Sp77]KLU74477.1 conserved hypothetical phage-related protein [Clostridium botulinum V891]KOA77625.1 hypothetical protein ADU77_07465 [Clostridium botulinum]KOA85046.1 hypothetical protein ADU74_10275 [Clostridium botulinum]